ncbi:FAD-dependent oxidoreductase [Desulfovibrio sp. OttesenSCG-928-F20]|nr:FAD-dependent oxidoreductase [Desulfovibrio sp. OttesenSCG-928-M16]MDL2290760.1 FAD-dependent oxidoreductase [Desulfovibrio sp. OttesenSCG-928-F20]
MRRIIIIAAGPAGIACATRIKRRLYEHEINVIIPSAVTAKERFDGPAGRRFAALLPDVDALALREIGVLETDDLMPDLEAKEITVGSSRGRLTVRYSDLVLEVPATVRPPHSLRKANNVFVWPMPGFAARPADCDAALAGAAASGEQVVVTGNGAPALEAALLALEAGAKVHWLRTAQAESPALEEQLLGVAIQALGPNLTVSALPGTAAEELIFHLDADGKKLVGLGLPTDNSRIDCACCIWTAPLMARHPILREEGLVLDKKGRIIINDPAKCPGLRLMGSGSALENTRLPLSDVLLESFPGGEENADLSAWLAINDITRQADASTLPKALGVRYASGAGIQFRRAGLSMAEAQARNLDCEYACVSLPLESTQSAAEQGLLALSLVCDKDSRALLGAQALGTGLAASETDGLFGLALAGLADGVSVSSLARRSPTGLPGALLQRACAVLVNKLDTIIQGITPEEFLASRAAGAEFFTLDLRSLPDWKQGHVPGAYNIPLAQLKKRIQDEVPRFTPIVTVSASGRDAYVAACRMAGLGAKDLYVLDGGMALWPFKLERE